MSKPLEIIVEGVDNSNVDSEEMTRIALPDVKLTQDVELSDLVARIFWSC